MSQDYDFDSDPAAGDDIKDVEPDDIDAVVTAREQEEAEQELDAKLEEAHAEQDNAHLNAFLETEGAKYVGMHKMGEGVSPTEFDIRASYASIINNLFRLHEFARSHDTSPVHRPIIHNHVKIAAESTAKACEDAVAAARYVQEHVSA